MKFVEKALAHEGETHESAVESTAHFLEPLTDPVAAIPIFILVLLVVNFALKKSPLPSSVRMLTLLGLMFVGSILGFIFVPPLGILGVLMGFVFAGLLVFQGIKEG